MSTRTGYTYTVWPSNIDDINSCQKRIWPWIRVLLTSEFQQLTVDNLKITHLVLGGENLSAKLVCQLLEKVNKHSWAKIIAFYQLKFAKNSTTAGQPRKRRNNSSQCSDKTRESMHMTSLKPRLYTKTKTGHPRWRSICNPRESDSICKQILSCFG